MKILECEIIDNENMILVCVKFDEPWNRKDMSAIEYENKREEVGEMILEYVKSHDEFKEDVEEYLKSENNLLHWPYLRECFYGCKCGEKDGYEHWILE